MRWSFQVGNWITSSPVVGSDGTIYFGSWDGYLYALNPDGSLKWRALNPGETYAILSSPALSPEGATVYIGSWGADKPYLYAVRAEDGVVKWKFTDPGLWVALIESSPTIAEDGTIYIGISDVGGSAHLYALRDEGDAANLLWKLELDGPRIVSTPAIGFDGTIYVAGPYGGQGGYLYAINPDGTLKWKYPLRENSISSPIVDKMGVIYVGCYDDSLYAIQDRESEGVLMWRFIAGENIHSSPAIGSDGTIYFGSDDGFLYALNVEPETITVTVSSTYTTTTTEIFTITETDVRVFTSILRRTVVNPTTVTLFETFTREVVSVETFTETVTSVSVATIPPVTTTVVSERVLTSLNFLPVVRLITFTRFSTLTETTTFTLPRTTAIIQPAPEMVEAPSPWPEIGQFSWFFILGLLPLIGVGAVYRLTGQHYAVTPSSPQPVRGVFKVGDAGVVFKKVLTLSRVFEVERRAVLAWEEATGLLKGRIVPALRITTLEGEYLVMFPGGVPGKLLERLGSLFS